MKKNYIFKGIIIVILFFNVSMLRGCTTITVDKVCVNNVGAKTLNYNDVKYKCKELYYERFTIK